MSLRAHREALPASQQQLWGQLRGLDQLGFVLYEGTAIALPSLAKASVLQDQPDALTVLSPGGGVKVSFFAGLTIGCIQPAAPAR